jgi:GxxExxY protein
MILGEGRMESDKLTEEIIGCAYRVHNELGAGFLEKVYENALCIELAEAGLQVEQQVPVQVSYRGHLVGDFCADLLVEEKVIVELKAVRDVVREHEVQLVNYLNATGVEIGLLINFGPSVQVRRKYRIYRRRVFLT